MSHVRKVALVLVIVISAFAGWQRGAANADVVAGDGLPSIDLTAPGSFKLVKAWCQEACSQGCQGHGGCLSTDLIGCTCYWICEDFHTGESYCGGAIGVKVCNDVAGIITKPTVAELLAKPIDTM